jgi:hypothetical protein
VATELANVGLTTTVTGRIDAAISTRSTYAGTDTSGTTTLLSRVPTTVSSQASNDQIYAAIDTEVAAIKAQTDKLQFAAGNDVKATLDFETVTVAVNNDKTGYALTSAYDAAKSAASQASVDAIKAVVDAIKLIDDKLNTAMEVDGPVYRFTTNALEMAPTGGGGTVIDNNAIADALLKRDWTAVSGEALYSLLNAARMLRNVWSTAGGTLTVKKEDGSTTAWTRTLSTDPSALPITGAT